MHSWGRMVEVGVLLLHAERDQRKQRASESGLSVRYVVAIVRGRQSTYRVAAPPLSCHACLVRPYHRQGLSHESGMAALEWRPLPPLRAVALGAVGRGKALGRRSTRWTTN